MDNNFIGVYQRFRHVVLSMCFVQIIYLDLLFVALDTTNTVVKKQVIELLSALCVYSNDGYERALSALEHYKVSDVLLQKNTNSYYAFSPKKW